MSVYKIILIFFIIAIVALSPHPWFVFAAIVDFWLIYSLLKRASKSDYLDGNKFTSDHDADFYDQTRIDPRGIPLGAGEMGEHMVYQELLKLAMAFDLRFLHNVYLPAGKDFSEADLICVCEKGIVVIESKNYVGWIFGNDENKYWTQSIYNRSTRQTEKFRFYNPVWQNATHVRNLRKVISDESIPVWSVIVFGDNCQLKDVTLRHDDDALIFKTSSACRDLVGFLSGKESVLSGAKIDAIYSKLYPYTRVSSDIKRQHIEWIQEIRERG